MSHPELHRGMRGNAVIEAKKDAVRVLKAAGHKVAAAAIVERNPVFGTGLYNGVKIIQHDHHLEVDGVIGPHTWTVLDPVNHPHVDPRVTKLLKVAASQIGVHETGGNNRGPQVERYIHAAHGVVPESWCGDFVDWCQIQAGLPVHHTARSVEGLLVWGKAQGRFRTSNPTPGMACIMGFDGTGVGEHVGIVEKVTPGGVQNIEGNTSPTGSGSQANGDGVYRKPRARNLIIGYVNLL